VRRLRELVLAFPRENLRMLSQAALHLVFEMSYLYTPSQPFAGLLKHVFSPPGLSFERDRR